MTISPARPLPGSERCTDSGRDRNLARPGSDATRREFDLDVANGHRGGLALDASDFGFDQIGVADEVGHEDVARPLVEVARLALLGDLGVAHDDDLVGDG